MKWYDYLSLCFGLVGIGCAIWFYVHLFRWGRLIRHGRLVVAVKNKVHLNAPIEEWALWARAAEKDPNHQSRMGRIVFDKRDVKIAVLTKSFEPDPWWKRLHGWATKRVLKRKSSAPRAREGTWTAEDHTAKPVSDVRP